jgi:hypothetical protein
MMGISISASARNNGHLLAAMTLGCYYPEMPLLLLCCVFYLPVCSYLTKQKQL